MADRAAILTDTATPQARPTMLRRVPRPLVGGMLFGALLLLIWFQLQPKWIFYTFLGTVMAAALPVILMLIPSLDRFFLALFLFSQQLYLSFNFIAGDQAMPGGVMGLNVSLQFLLALLYLAAWRFRATKDEDEDRTFSQPFVRACTWFLVAVSLSLLNTGTKTHTIFGIFYHVGLVACALAACHICSSRSGIAALWKGIWVIAITQSIVLLIQRSLNVSFSLTGEVMDSVWGERYGGTMGIAPVSVATLLMGLVLFAEMRLLRGNSRTLFTWGPAFGLSFLCLLLSLTRSAWIGCGIGSVFVLWWIVRRGSLSARRGMLLAAAAFVGMVIAYGPVRDRLDANHQNAAEERWRLNYINLEMWKSAPLLGIGLNTAYESKKMYIPSFFTDGDWIYIAHNQYLLIAAEAGLVGLIAFVRLLWVAIRSAAAGARARDPAIGETGAVLLAYLVAFLWGMNLDFYGGMQVYGLLWFILGCAAGVRECALREAAAATTT